MLGSELIWKEYTSAEIKPPESAHAGGQPKRVNESQPSLWLFAIIAHALCMLA